MKTIFKLNPAKLIIICIISLSGNAMAQGLSSQNNQIKDPAIDPDVANLVYIPNSFTPNGDGTNDEFMVFSDQLKKISLRIYDNKGEEVFATIQMTQGWNGKHLNTELKQDVYLYRLEATYLNGDDEVIIGHINLMR